MTCQGDTAGKWQPRIRTWAGCPRATLLTTTLSSVLSVSRSPGKKVSVVMSPDRPLPSWNTCSRIGSGPTFPIPLTRGTAHSVTAGALYPWSSKSFLIYKNGTNAGQKGLYVFCTLYFPSTCCILESGKCQISLHSKLFP